MLILFLLASLSLWAQSGEDVSLGDLARSLRETKAPKVRTVIDNENLVQVMDEVQQVKVSGGTPLFTFDQSGKNFEMSSPDGTCSLSFNANATALISNPYMARDLPPSEVANLDGAATLNSDVLEISLQNRSGWDLSEITVGLTIVRPPAEAAARDQSSGPALENVSLPSPEISTEPSKRAESTILYHLKGSAIAGQNAEFQEILSTVPGSGEEWHWAIVEAKGVPPHALRKPQASPSAMPIAPLETAQPQAPVPQTSQAEFSQPLGMQPQPAATVVVGQARP